MMAGVGTTCEQVRGKRFSAEVLERQWLKLATHMGEQGGVYVLDEPATCLADYVGSGKARPALGSPAWPRG